MLVCVFSKSIETRNHFFHGNDFTMAVHKPVERSIATVAVLGKTDLSVGG